MKKLTVEEEKLLLKNCIENDEKELIVRQYKRLIDSIIYKQFKRNGIPCLQDDIEDIGNDVFVKIFEKNCKRLRLYKPEKGRSLANWIIMITSQTVADFTHKIDIAKREKQIPIEELIENPCEQAQEKKLESRESLRLITGYLKCLSPDQRLILQLYFFDDPPKSLEDIAKLTNRTKQAVYNIKHRAVKRLKQLFTINGY